MVLCPLRGDMSESLVTLILVHYSRTVDENIGVERNHVTCQLVRGQVRALGFLSSQDLTFKWLSKL